MVFQFCLEISNFLRLLSFFNSKLKTKNSKPCLNGVFVQALVRLSNPLTKERPMGDPWDFFSVGKRMNNFGKNTDMIGGLNNEISIWYI